VAVNSKGHTLLFQGARPILTEYDEPAPTPAALGMGCSRIHMVCESSGLRCTPLNELRDTLNYSHWIVRARFLDG